MESSKLFDRESCKFLVIAHRGASFYAPENTMAAFRLAYEMGADMIELDVQLSKDGVPVVIHDANLSKTTNGKGIVSDFTLSELKKLDAGSWFSDHFINEKIPSLEEVLDWASGTISLNIEIKPEAAAGPNQVEDLVHALVKKYKMEKYVVFSSFDPRVILTLNHLEPELITGLLYSRRDSDPVRQVQDYKADFFHVNYRWLNTRRLNRLNGQEIPVLVYTVNHVPMMRQLIRGGVYGIFSDRPDLLKTTADSELENRCTKKE